MAFHRNSVGLVTPQTFTATDHFYLSCGQQLPGFQLKYETYGKLNSAGDNAILVCHALSGNHHVAGYHSELETRAGWWDTLIGPGKPVDTDHFFVVCPNNIGGCHGSTGPMTVNPDNGRIWAADFPLITVVDWVRSQRLLRDHLGISKWYAVIGPSLGGMQALQWAIEYPKEVHNSVIIAAAPQLSAQNIAFNEIARRSITSDPDYHQGNYHSKATIPRLGLMLARMLGHVTYLSNEMMHEKFGRNKQEDGRQFSLEPEFMVESYLHYQANKFADGFDANTYLLMTKALDYYDPAAAFGNDLVACLQQVQARFLVVSFSSDWRFSPEQSESMVTAMLRAGKNVSYACVSSKRGHDSFLLPDDHYHRIVHNFLLYPPEKPWNTPDL